MKLSAVYNFTPFRGSLLEDQDDLNLSHIHPRKQVYCDPDIVLWKAPSQVWETDVEAGEGGKGGEVDRASGSSERPCAARTFFSLYKCKCVSACVLHWGAWCWHHSSQWNMPLHIWPNDRADLKSFFFLLQNKSWIDNNLSSAHKD